MIITITDPLPGYYEVITDTCGPKRFDSFQELILFLEEICQKEFRFEIDDEVIMDEVETAWKNIEEETRDKIVKEVMKTIKPKLRVKVSPSGE